MILGDIFRKKFLLWSGKCGNPKLVSFLVNEQRDARPTICKIVHHCMFIFCWRVQNKVSWAVTNVRTNIIFQQIHPPRRHESTNGPLACPLVVKLISQAFLIKMENKILSAEYQILKKILLVFLWIIYKTKLLFWSFLKIVRNFQILPKLFETFQLLASNRAEIKTIVLRY